MADSFLPQIMDARNYALEPSAQTFTELTQETLGDTASDSDGFALKMSEYAESVAAFERDLPNLAADVAQLPGAGDEPGGGAADAVIGILDGLGEDVGGYDAESSAAWNAPIDGS